MFNCSLHSGRGTHILGSLLAPNCVKPVALRNLAYHDDFVSSFFLAHAFSFLLEDFLLLELLSIILVHIVLLLTHRFVVTHHEHLVFVIPFTCDSACLIP